jgi:glycerol-3-phosphate acyltransferase PlsY
MVYLVAILFIFMAYLFGSIPVGYVVARMYGVDVTASGSGAPAAPTCCGRPGRWPPG